MEYFFRRAKTTRDIRSAHETHTAYTYRRLPQVRHNIRFREREPSPVRRVEINQASVQTEPEKKVSKVKSLRIKVPRKGKVKIDKVNTPPSPKGHKETPTSSSDIDYSEGKRCDVCKRVFYNSANYYQHFWCERGMPV